MEVRAPAQITLRGPVLVASDLSSAAGEALRQGARLATGLASRWLVCHVVPELIPDGSVFSEFRRANLKAVAALAECPRHRRAGKSSGCPLVNFKHPSEQGERFLAIGF